MNINFPELLIILVLVVLAGIKEATYDENLKTLSGYVQLAVLSAWALTVSFYTTEPFFFVRYGLTRLIFYDLIYNVTRSLTLFYVGNIKPTDRFLRWIFRKNVEYGYFFLRIILLPIAIFFENFINLFQ